MRHGMAHRKLNRTSEHRKALFKNMICSLVEHESIRTTLPKAKELRPLAERMVTLGKRYAGESDAGKLHVRRLAISKIGSQSAVEKLLTVLADRFRSRNGGYLRIVKAGFRCGDCAPMAVISFVDHDPSAAKASVEGTAEVAAEA